MLLFTAWCSWMDDRKGMQPNKTWAWFTKYLMIYHKILLSLS